MFEVYSEHWNIVIQLLNRRTKPHKRQAFYKYYKDLENQDVYLISAKDNNSLVDLAKVQRPK